VSGPLRRRIQEETIADDPLGRHPCSEKEEETGDGDSDETTPTGARSRYQLYRASIFSFIYLFPDLAAAILGQH